jgi:hypothetical protein
VLWTTHLLSWLAPSSSLALALANYPEFALGRLEIYRIFTSLLVNPGFVDSLLFHLAVVPPAKTLEGSLGSARLAYYIAALSIATNLLFLAGWLLLAPWGAPSAWRLAQYTSSLWIAGFGLLSLEAVRADNLSIAGYGDDGDHEDASRSSSKYRRVCFLTVRTRYSPLAMYGLMTLLSMRFDAGYLISLLLGYAAAYQWCHGAVDRCLLSCLSLSRIQGWEAGGGWLSRFVSSPPSSSWTGGGGYVSARSATGIQASWGQSAEPRSGSVSTLSPFTSTSGTTPHRDLPLRRVLTPCILFPPSTPFTGYLGNEDATAVPNVGKEVGTNNGNVGGLCRRYRARARRGRK